MDKIAATNDAIDGGVQLEKPERTRWEINGSGTRRPKVDFVHLTRAQVREPLVVGDCDDELHGDAVTS